MSMVTILSIWGIYFIGVALNLYIYHDSEEGITEGRFYVSLLSWIMFLIAMAFMLFDYDGASDKE